MYLASILASSPSTPNIACGSFASMTYHSQFFSAQPYAGGHGGNVRIGYRNEGSTRPLPRTMSYPS